MGSIRGRKDFFITSERDLRPTAACTRMLSICGAWVAGMLRVLCPPKSLRASMWTNNEKISMHCITIHSIVLTVCSSQACKGAFSQLIAQLRSRVQIRKAINFWHILFYFHRSNPHHGSQAMSLLFFKRQHLAPSDGGWRCAQWRQRWWLFARHLQQQSASSHKQPEDESTHCEGIKEDAK
jgi:hypothetical protein